MKEEFEALLRPELFLEISGSGDLRAKETDGCASLKCLHIKWVPEGSVAFKLDHHPKGELKIKLKNCFNQLSCLIHGEHERANKSCDFVIVSQNENNVKVILGELKSSRRDRSKADDQLRNSEIFLQFLFNLLSEYHGLEVVPEFKKIFFFVGRPSNAKAPTRQKNQPPRLKRDEVLYYPVTLEGWKNSHARVAYSHFS